MRIKLHRLYLYQIARLSVKDNLFFYVLAYLTDITVEKCNLSWLGLFVESHIFPSHSQNTIIFLSCKMPEFFEKSPLSEAEKHPDFQVTLWSSRRKALSFRHTL